MDSKDKMIQDLIRREIEKYMKKKGGKFELKYEDDDDYEYIGGVSATSTNFPITTLPEYKINLVGEGGELIDSLLLPQVKLTSIRNLDNSELLGGAKKSNKKKPRKNKLSAKQKRLYAKARKIKAEGGISWPESLKMAKLELDC